MTNPTIKPTITVVIRFVILSTERVELLQFETYTGGHILEWIQDRYDLFEIREGNIEDHADELASAISVHHLTETGNRCEVCVTVIESNGTEILQYNNYFSSGTIMPIQPFEVFVNKEHPNVGVAMWGDREMYFLL